MLENCNDAINHINKYGTMHTDSIITRNKKTANKFLKNIKSSIAMHNTSTQFADGGEFGFGSERLEFLQILFHQEVLWVWDN